MNLDERLSLLASQLWAGMLDSSHSLCCAEDSHAMCAMIVGDKAADDLRGWTYEALGCSWSEEQRERIFELYLDKVLALGPDGLERMRTRTQ